MSADQVLARVPQQSPFRFIDEILEIDDEHIVAAVRFPAGADFYRGHFPGNPVTPGVLLVEAMAQAGVVALGIHLVARELGVEQLDKLVTVFTDATVEFAGAVRPGERVITTGRKLFFRRRKLRSKVEMRREDGSLVCSGELSGMGVPR
ncbi:MAG: 3-hydroxyacyl-ACP dehydratase FabZ family protein [Myxococcota bacterium]